MGNCLVRQQKIIKIIRDDGKELEYKAPIKVHEVLSYFSGHAMFGTTPENRILQPDTELVGGETYYLRPLSLQTVRRRKGSAVVRVKVVMSKQELKELLARNGVSVCEVVSQLQDKGRVKEVDMFCGDGDHENCKGWKPVLESIAEAN